MSLAADHAHRQRRMKLRLAGMVIAIVGAVAIVIWYRQRERAEEREAAERAHVEATGSPAAARPGADTPTTKDAPAAPPRVRKIDRQARAAILDRIRTARTARTGGNAAPTGGSPAPPALPALPGTISKDDIRAGVRAVIPLLAECYDAAQDRLSIKDGKIVVQMHLTGEPEVGTLIETAEIEGDAHFTGDAELVECLQQTMLSVELPPIAEGGTVDVTYPLAFSPG